jgi:signal transduction histidine kinase
VSNPRVELRTAAGTVAATDAGLAASFVHGGSLYTEIYPTPLPGGGTQSVAGSLDNLGLQPRLVLVRATVEQTVELLGERYKGGLPVPVDVERDAQLGVPADADKLSRVLRPVLDNAVKFSEGRVRVLIVSAGRGGAVRIDVADEGAGIAEEELPHVSDRFYQVDNTATRSHGGTGMGLALVKRMVEAHGARVEVSSVTGKGTRVVLTWPTRAVDDQSSAAGRAAPATTTAAGAALPVQ